MADDKSTTGENTPNTQQTGSDTPPAGASQPTQEQFLKIQADLESFKKEISSRDKKISSLQKEIESKELEKLSEVEREKKEVELAKAEKEKTLLEIEQIKIDRIKDRELNNAGIPVEFAKRIMGSTEEEIQKDVLEFKNFIDALVKAKIPNNAGIGNSRMSAAGGKKEMKADAFNLMSPKDRAAFMAQGGQITE